MTACFRNLSLALLLAATQARPATAQSITAELVLSGFSSPIDLAAAPGDARVFLAELGGKVHVIENGVVRATPFCDISSVIAFGSFTGLRGLVFHPDYASNGQFYVWYEAPAGAQPDIVLARMSVSAGDPNVADFGTLVELLRFDQQQQWHGGGDLSFGPDGYLYCGTGDGWGLGQDSGCNAQNGAVLKGKILRIDVDSAFPYAIPADNPFVSDPMVRDEIWHLGLRHPWRWSFDSATGDMYIGDVGESTREEVNFAPAGVGGLNFGWKVMEGTGCYNNSGCSSVAACGDASYTLPIHDFPHSGGPCSITGGFVYRGDAIPSLYGHYVFSDWCTGRVWSLRYVGGIVQDFQERTAELGGPFDNVVSFGLDDVGEIYFMNGGGELYQIRADCGGTSFCTTSANSVGPGASITVAGSPSISANNFSLNVSGSVPNAFGIFFYGPNQISVPFGDGLRCVGGSTHRLQPPIASDGLGNISRPVNFNLPPVNAGSGQIFGGSQWNFQFWYRDMAGAGGTGFNLSDGTHVVFCP